MVEADIIRHTVSPDVTIIISDDDQVISPDLEQAIDEIWTLAKQESDATLFNGTLYSVTDISPECITVKETQYKHYYAQHRDNRLFKTLGIRPLACSGALRCSEGFILGRRSDKVAIYQGCWELAPCGTFDETCKTSDTTLEPRILFKNEVTEELGIPANLLDIGKVLTAIEDQQTRAVDIIVQATSQLIADDVSTYFSQRQTDEYDEVRVIGDGKIKEFTQLHEGHFVNTALDALDFMNLL